MKKKKIIFALLIIAMIISISNLVFAAPAPGNIKIENGNIHGAEDLKQFGEKVFGIIQIVGIISSVIILAVIGIKTLMGSAQDKAVYIKAFMPYLIGAIILFAAPTIAKIVYDISEEISKSNEEKPADSTLDSPLKPPIKYEETKPVIK